MKFFTLTISLFLTISTFSQVGIGTNSPNAAALLDLTSTDKGLLVPRVSLQQTSLAAPLANHVAGMIVYNTNTAGNVSPGFYINDGSSWMSVSAAIKRLDSLSAQVESLKNDIPIKRAVFLAGQSNTHYGSGSPQNLPDMTGKNLSQLGRGALELQVIPLTYYGAYHYTRQTDKISFGSVFLNYYYDSLQAQYPGRKIELLLVPCGAGNSAWSASQYPSNSWRTDAEYFRDVTERIKWVKNNGYQIDAFLWHQGETDALDNTLNYKDLLKNFIRSIRDYSGNDSLPFILGQMVQSWVGGDATRNSFQNIINDIPNEVPFTYTVSSAGLTTADVIHFDANAHVELGRRYCNALPVAKNNRFPVNYQAPASGNYLLLNQNGSATFTDIFQAIRNGNLESDNLYSRLGDMWKYKNANGYYHFKLEIVDGGVLTGKYFEWEQKIDPFGLRENNFEDKASCIILANTIGLNVQDPAGQGFNSLVYDTNNSSNGSFPTLFHADNRTTSGYYYFAIGLKAPFGGRIPIVETNDVVNQVKLYSIKE
ncbi:MAG: hypothetical protein JWQ27_578 [Ferruginibacter sp.]|nr:hypothetical protein [Ferruginibacter sp.]